MAITLLTQPSTPNVSDTRLVYSISSSNSLSPQFQFVTDIYEQGGSDLLTRLYSYPNPYGTGIVEISKILGDNLEYDNDWKTSGGTSATTSFKGFDIKFGEAYGTSISSSVTVYPNLTTNTLQVFPGTVDINGGSFNFPNQTTYQLLSNQTQGYITNDIYVTIPVYAPSFATVGFKDIKVEFLDKDGALLFSNNCTLIPSTNYEIYQQGIGIGTGLFNNPFTLLDWEYIKIYELATSTLLTTFNRVRPCNGDGVNFAFINKYGYYDYYSTGNPVRKNTDVTREIYTQTKVDYTSIVSTYDISRRGETQYNTRYADNFEVTTDYHDQVTADWLTELFDSPNVFIQESGNFIPIIITNTNYEWNMNENRQKLFQYTINYKYANNRYGR